ncbi:MAG: hypothetical protein HY594_02350 [Candidatus Omnitrophica bacterium]|nr:hypothetical protein [Candidatus Omnitrophota bacterium]
MLKLLRWVGSALAAGIAFSAAAVAVSWLLLISVRPMIERKISESIGCEVRYGWAWVTPWAGVVVSDLRVTPSTGQPRLAVSRLLLQYEWKDLFSRRWDSVGQVTLQSPHLILTQGDAPETLPAALAASSSQKWIKPVQIFVDDGHVSVPGLASLFHHGSADAQYDGQRILIRRAHVQALDADLRVQGEIGNFKTHPQWALDFRLAHPKFSGQLEIDGNAQGSALTGYWQPAEEGRVPLFGHVKFLPHRVEAADVQAGAFQAATAFLDFMEQQWGVTVLGPGGKQIVIRSRGKWQRPQCELVIGDFPLGPVSMTTTARLTAKLSESGKGLEGTASTFGTALNRRSFGELSGFWSLTKDTLHLRSFALGAAYRLSGSIGIPPPHALHLILDITGADIGQIAATIEPGKAPLASGLVNGQIQLSGSLDAVRMKGYLTGRDGKIGRTPFEIAIVNFEGEGSVVRFLDSRIQNGGSEMLILEGALDVSKLGTQSVFGQVRLTPFQKTKAAETPEKAAEPRIAVRRTLDAEVSPESVPSEEVDVGLKILGTDGQKTKLKYRKQGEDKLMGVEHQVKF